MTNIFKKNLSIEWTVKANTGFHAVKSDTFSFQNRTCYLEYCSGSTTENQRRYPCLLFWCKFKGNPLFKYEINVFMSSKLVYNKASITKSNCDILWDHSRKEELSDHIMTFKCIFLDDICSNDDKAVQTVSYMDNCFLMEETARDFSKMLHENSGQDVEFICGDQSIKAHKSVLSCRSDVFASMLQSEMSEGSTGQVNIEDMDATLFQQFLKFLYTGVLPTFTVHTALKFYEAGDKYNVSPLKKQCKDFLMDHLLPENAYDVLILADRHSDGDLKRSVIDFMLKEEMPNSGERWTEFCKQNPILAVEILNLFCQHLRLK